MPVVGLIPFVYAAIKKKRRSSTARARADRYAQIAAGATAARLDGGGGYLSQSCHFAVRPPSPPYDLGFSYDDDDDCAARHPPPESLSRKLSSADRYDYERLVAATGGREDARFDGGGKQTQSCRFAARPWTADEVGSRCDGGYGYARRTQPGPEGMRCQLLPPASRDDKLATGATPGREVARFDFDDGGYQSQSCRFAARPSPVDELGVSRDDGGAPRRPEGLTRQLLLPGSVSNRLSTGMTEAQEKARSHGSGHHHQSQSCRFAARPSAANELGFWRGEGYGAASPPPEDLSGKLLLPAGGRERAVSRSRRFNSMRVFAWVSGA